MPAEVGAAPGEARTCFSPGFTETLAESTNQVSSRGEASCGILFYIRKFRRGASAGEADRPKAQSTLPIRGKEHPAQHF